ncbi:MAG: polysaccharide biosynthesis tyrosine autokinase [Planctomycetota bacterium]
MTQLVPTREQATRIVRQAPAPTRSQAGSGSGLTGRDLVRILRKRIWLIVISVVVCLAIAAIGTMLWLFYAPLYTATALLGVTPPQVSELNPQGGTASPQYLQRLTVDRAQMASRPEVLEMAASNRDLQFTPELQRTAYYRRNKDIIVDKLSQDVSFAPLTDANLIRVSMTGRAADLCSTVVNAVAIAAEEDGKNRTIRRYEEDINKLQARLVEEQRALDELEEAQARLPVLVRPGESPRMLELRRRQTLVQQRMADLGQQIAEIRAAQQHAETAKLVAQEHSVEEYVELPEVQFAAQNDPLVSSLRSDLLRLRTELDNVRQKFGPDHIAVKNLEMRVQATAEQLRARELQVARMMKQDRIAAPENYAQQHEQLMREQDRLEAEAADIEEMLAAEMQRIEEQRGRNQTQWQEALSQQRQHDREERILRERCNRIENRLLELQLLTKGEPPLRVVSAAWTPDDPSWPKWSVMLPLGAVLGLLIGVGLAVMLELIDTSIKNPADMSRRMDLPLLGMVPHAEDLADEIADMRLAFLDAPDSLVDEAFRQIRTGLLFSGPASERRSLLVTSPLPGDGRSTVALNLAASVARSGRKVLVVDANFRQPCVDDVFPDCAEEGLSSALVGRARWQDNVHQVEENFHVLQAGPLPPNPAELLGSDTMQTLIAEMQQQYDQVLFDGPPCVVVTDAQVLSTQVDGVILVVRAGANTYGVVQRTRDMIQRVGGHILGAVLNGVRVTAGGYLRKNYETYYQYHQQQQPPPELTES